MSGQAAEETRGATAAPLKEPAPAEFEFIDTKEALASWVERARTQRSSSEEKRGCLDTEADSLHHFREKICLLQVACGGMFALVDPLAIEDVTPVLELLDEEELWFHGSDYDLSMLERTYDWMPRTVRDTQIAARLAGHRQFGLAALVKNVFGVELSKASQKADWSKRPLSEVMLRYAVDDVRFLLPLADHLEGLLREKDRMPWFFESCAALQRDVHERLQTPREDPWRVQGAGRLHPRGLAFLREAWNWREAIAEERDLPCFRVMSNKQMLGYATAFEKGEPVRPPNGWRPRWKRAFEVMLQDLSEQEKSQWPQRLKRPRQRFSEAQRSMVDRLCSERDRFGAELDIESSLLGSRATLEQVVGSGSPQGLLLDWQRLVLAEVLSQVPAAASGNS